MKLLILQHYSVSRFWPSILSSNTLLRTQRTNILKLRSFLNVTNEASRPYKATVQIRASRVLIFDVNTSLNLLP
jgi:hypothetical protein